VLPGGRYLRERLRGEPPDVYDEIAPTFQMLVEQAEQERPGPASSSTAGVTRSICFCRSPVRGRAAAAALLEE
jgi:hypothetical protein